MRFLDIYAGEGEGILMGMLGQRGEKQYRFEWGRIVGTAPEKSTCFRLLSIVLSSLRYIKWRQRLKDSIFEVRIA